MCKVCEAEGALLGEVDRVTLENTLPGHNKQYTIYLEEMPGCLYRVMARYGPIGKWEKAVEKTTGGHTVHEAREILDRIRRQKERKGYKVRVCRE